ncbi:hypothetical protein BT63DRAFT_326639 [Microthyrium microscopicum]|uniref:Uncharacterized protein n=1 Tax=Microthyrium microscopicum TaxID=703497 RepID=A0A6A6U6S1_9PEZI|nr:hypothetical protein BT63DRAFT_326639 [Microthyrium microscopicum]
MPLKRAYIKKLEDEVDEEYGLKGKGKSSGAQSKKRRALNSLKAEKKKSKKSRVRGKYHPLHIAKVYKSEGTGILQIENANPSKKVKLDRIMKCIIKADHPNTPEQEKKSSLFLAQRECERLKFTVDKVRRWMKYKTKDGISTVRIERYAEDGRGMTNEGFVPTLADAIAKAWALIKFSTRAQYGGKFFIEWSFFGVANRTTQAAQEFVRWHRCEFLFFLAPSLWVIDCCGFHRT